MIKKVLISLLAASVSSSVLAAGSINGKIGGAYASDPEKFGLNLNVSYYRELDPYFHIGFDPSFCWVKWRDKLENITTESGISGSKVRDTDAYMIPVLGSAKVRIVSLRDKLHGFLPYATIGLGYSPMILTYQNSSGKNKADVFGGFTWQTVIGASFSPSAESKIEFLAEAGYRSARLQNNDDIEINMSGIIFNAGICFPF